MANTIDTQKIQDGDRNAVFRVYLLADATGEETDTAIVDVSTLNADEHGNAVDNVKIKRIHANLVGFSARLEWDADTDDEILVIPDGSEVDYDYCRAGGLVNPKSTNYTGDITITTTGFDAAGDEGYIYLECAKKYG